MPILYRCIAKNAYFNSGLDVGCGTGRSTIALAKYCDSVIGIDPSQQMLDNAIQASNIKYLNGSLEELTLKSDFFDIVTLAGSLYYAKSQKLYDEILRVSKSASQIIIYDFEMVLEFRHDLPYEILGNNKSKYNHEINFSGLLDEKLKLVQTLKEKSNLSISPSDLAHLILSEKRTYEQLALKWGAGKVFENSREILRAKSYGKNHEIEANIFYTIYQNIK